MGTERTNFKRFSIDGTVVDVIYGDTIPVRPGVECDVYRFRGDDTRDLGIIRIEPGASTPLQRILEGERTIEGHLGGIGTLFITRADGTEEEHHVDDELHEPFSTVLNIGDTMQWQATGDVVLLASEVCYPPYEPGRFEDLD